MPLSWEDTRSDLNGSRYNVWEAYYKTIISWSNFKDASKIYNPQITQTGWCFVPGETYIMPKESVNPISPVVTETEDDDLRKVLMDVPYISQVGSAVTWTYKYFGSDSDSSDSTRDGCWMNPRIGRNYGYGVEANGCKGPWEPHENGLQGQPIGCVRPGCCNTTSLYMMLCYFGLTEDINEKNKLNERRILIDKLEENLRESAPPRLGKREPCALRDWFEKTYLGPSWIYAYIMEWYIGKQLWVPGDPISARNSSVVARDSHMKQFAKLLIDSHQEPEARQIKVNRTTSADLALFSTYKQCIDKGSPVVINSGRMHHIVCGIGYEFKNGIPYAVVHDPYGWKGEEVGKWKKYNQCGHDGDTEGTKGKETLYNYSQLEVKYLLWLEGSSLKT